MRFNSFNKRSEAKRLRIDAEIWIVASKEAMRKSTSQSKPRTQSHIKAVIWLLFSVLTIYLLNQVYGTLLGDFAALGQVILYLLACIILYILERKHII